MPSRDQKYKILLILFGLIVFVVAIFFIVRGNNFQLFNAKGEVASGEREIMFTALGLMLLVLLPILGTASYIIWKYQVKDENNPQPIGHVNSKMQLLWWGIPALLIIILIPVTWNGAHALDPFKPLVSNEAPLTVQVVALRWKWLFIYPEQNLATVNYLEIPVNRPVHFELTSDGLMNSFWIPQLGGQIYAMAGMETQINLMADSFGNFQGQAAEINGAGFAGMKFMTHSVSTDEFNTWVNSVKAQETDLSYDEYNKLAQPTENTAPTTYAKVDRDLFEEVMSKFMEPQSN